MTSQTIEPTDSTKTGKTTAAPDQSVVIERCRFCASEEQLYGRACRKCREELRQWSRERFAGSGLDVPPHEIDVMTKTNLDQWREWVKRMDGGEGSYGHDRQATIDAIFDAAWVGMKKAKSSRKSYDKTIVRTLRDLADQIERQTR